MSRSVTRLARSTCTAHAHALAHAHVFAQARDPDPRPTPAPHLSQVRELSAEEKAALYAACLPGGALLGAHARRASAMAAARARTIGTTEASNKQSVDRVLMVHR